MLLPDIASGKRFALPRPPGSADALLLARFAEKERARGSLLAIFSAEPADAQRLADEIPFFAPGLRVALFPDWETLPYDSFSPHQDLVSERLATLYQISHGACDVLIVPVTTALQRLPPVEFLAAYSFFLKQGERIEPETLRHQLMLAGYSHVTQVVSPGEYSFRGGVIDLFPMGSALPYRLDLFDNEVESIRTFDSDTQRSIYKVNEVRLLPESIAKARKAEVLEKAAGVATMLTIGDPSDPSTVVGPLISAAQRERCERYVAAAVDAGATVVAGGRRPADQPRGYFFEPTVLDVPDNSNPAAQDEIFGPVICVLGYRDVDHAVEIANDSIFGLSGQVFGGDLALATSIAERIRAGAVQVNGGEVREIQVNLDPGRLEALPLVRRVLLHGDPKAGAAAPEQVTDDEDRSGEVGFAAQPGGRLGRDGQRRAHEMLIV
jgi:hypothetical protein